MKKWLKIIIIILVIIVVVIFLDTMQALIFNNNPIIGMNMWCNKKAGLLVETYHCSDGRNITRLRSNNCYIEDVCDRYTNTNDIELSVKEGTISNVGATFILKNNTSNEYWYGPEYYIEKKENGMWKEIDTVTGYPLTWNAIAYTLKANDIIEINIDWSYGYGKLDSGIYRLVKSSFKEKDRPIDESKKIYLYAEFNVE